MQLSLNFQSPKHKPGTLYDIILRAWGGIPKGEVFSSQDFCLSLSREKFAKVSNYERRLRELRGDGELDYKVVKDGFIRKED